MGQKTVTVAGLSLTGVTVTDGACINKSKYNLLSLITEIIREVEAGEEVFNCYGPHFGRHPIAERRKILESQYRDG